jgi:hypothetical protein
MVLVKHGGLWNGSSGGRGAPRLDKAFQLILSLRTLLKISEGDVKVECVAAFCKINAQIGVAARGGVDDTQNEVSRRIHGAFHRCVALAAGHWTHAEDLVTEGEGGGGEKGEIRSRPLFYGSNAPLEVFQTDFELLVVDRQHAAPARRDLVLHQPISRDVAASLSRGDHKHVHRPADEQCLLHVDNGLLQSVELGAFKGGARGGAVSWHMVEMMLAVGVERVLMCRDIIWLTGKQEEV